RSPRYSQRIRHRHYEQPTLDQEPGDGRLLPKQRSRLLWQLHILGRFSKDFGLLKGNSATEYQTFRRSWQALTQVSSPPYSSHVNEICGLEDVGFDPLVRTLLGVADRLQSRVESALAASGLSFTKLGILHHLIQAGEPLPLKGLADRISCVKSNITQLM